MNKIGFCSGILSLILVFLHSIPLGIYFSSGISSYTTISLNLFNFNSLEYYMWGSFNPSTLEAIWWWDINFFGFIFIYVIVLETAIMTIVGSTVVGSKGKWVMRLNALLVIIVILFISFYIPINSIEILGNYMDPLMLFSSLGNGFILLVANFALAIIANKMHPIEED